MNFSGIEKDDDCRNSFLIDGHKHNSKNRGPIMSASPANHFEPMDLLLSIKMKFMIRCFIRWIHGPKAVTGQYVCAKVWAG